MDRALQERVIGAIVLVIFAVLVVPVFLNGPSQDTEIVTESVTLPGQNDQGTRQQTVVLKRDRTQPVPQSEIEVKVEPPPVTAAAKKPADVVPEKKPEPKKSDPAAATAAATSVTGMWAVQMGSFSEKVNAERLASELRNDGFAAFLSQTSTTAGQLHRVRIGPQKDRASADAIAAQLQKAGHKGQVVTHP